MVPELDVDRERALYWFRDHAGDLVDWPPTLDGLLLATRARGIYKPSGARYALSVRESVDSPYADRPPRYAPDGSWRYLYHQQGADTTSPETQWDDRSLNDCIAAELSVGVLRQLDLQPKRMYEVLGVARVIEWLDGYFVLQGEPSNRRISSQLVDIDSSAESGLLAAETSTSWTEEPTTRDRVLRVISRRRGQPAFRSTLLANYGRRCAVTACQAVPVLEAAHISTVPGADLNAPTNGLIMRADIHTLFDLGLIAIHDKDYSLLVSPEIEATEYGQYQGALLGLPSDPRANPNPAALRRHRVWAGL